MKNIKYGDLLYENINSLIELYRNYVTCVCFLGEGDNTTKTRNELILYSKLAHYHGMKSCIYSGRNVEVEDWMKEFDYVKVGSYIEALGGLLNNKTNQRLYMKKEDYFIDITFLFGIVIFICILLKF